MRENVYLVTPRQGYFEDMGWTKFAAEADVVAFIKDNDIFGLDLETKGLEFMIHDVWCMQVGNQNIQYVVDLDPDGEKVALRKYYRYIKGKTIVGQNLLFDIPFLYKHNIKYFKVYDTFNAENVLSCGINYHRGNRIARNLGALGKKYCEVDLDKTSQKTIAQTGLNSVEAVMYSGLDVAYVMQIRDRQLEVAKKWNLLDTIQRENDTTPALGYITFCGMQFDAKKWYKNTRYFEYLEWKYMLDLEEQWNSTYPDHKVEGFNWHSPDQVQQLFIERGIPVIDDGDGGKLSVSKTVISKLTQEYPLLKTYIDFRETNKLVTTYGRNWFDYPYKDNRIHTSFKQILETGRTSSGGGKKSNYPNTQNIPRRKKIKGCFIAKKGNKLIACDYSQQEGVILADVSQEPALLYFHQQGGGDQHCYVASLLWPELMKGLTNDEIKEQYPEQRSMAKSAGFAINYGGSGYTISNNLNMPPEVGEQVYSKYMAAFPQLADYFDAQEKLAMSKGHIRMPSGRVRFIENFREFIDEFQDNRFWTEYRTAKSQGGEDFEQEYKPKCKRLMRKKSFIRRLALNSPIQGVAADQLKMAMYLFFEWIVDTGNFNKVKIVNEIHDEIIVECKEEIAEEVAEKLKETMEVGANKFLTTLTMKAVYEIRDSW